MQVYETYEEAANAASVNCYKQVIPVKLSDIMEYAITCTTFPNCEKALDKAQKEWLQYWEEK